MNADSAHNSVWRIAEVIFGIPFLASIAFQGLIPFGLPEGIPRQILIPVGIILVTTGVRFIVSARREFTRYTQPADPGLPTTKVIQTGAFAILRNPLYFGSVLVITGIALMLNMLWALIALLLSIILCHRILIIPEEKYLIGSSAKNIKTTWFLFIDGLVANDLKSENHLCERPPNKSLKPNAYRRDFVRRESRVYLLTGRRVTFPETLFSPLPRNGVIDPAYAASK